MLRPAKICGKLSDRLDLTNHFSTSGYNPFTLNASGLTAISKTGITKLGLAEGHDILENDPGTGNNSLNALGFYMADQTGTANDPNLVVEHDSGVSAGSTTYGAKIENGDFRYV